MESNSGNLDGVEIPKKKRTLDLKSIYGSENVEVGNEGSEVMKRKDREEGDNVGGEERKRKRKKIGSKNEVGVNCVENSGRKSEKSLDKVYSDRISLATGDMGKKQLEPSQKSYSRRSNDSEKKSDSVSLGLEDDGAQIPKRKRDSVRRKHGECDKILAVAGEKLLTESSRTGLASDPFTGVNTKTMLNSEEVSFKGSVEKKLEHPKEKNTSGSKKS